MAVSFLANSWQLANWGFSAGDIAALAGAGRGVITWLSASGRDKALLDFLKTSSSDLGVRRGLIERRSLNKRWSTQIILFQNGRRCVFKPTGKEIEIENIDSFTWIMTIIVACLDVMVANSVLSEIVVQLLIRVFEDNALNVEYLQHEVPTHIQGWRSTACVRGMIEKSQHLWKLLEDQGRHLPGFAPSNESEEIIRLLHWLITGKSARYNTSSTDAFSLAVLLADLGFDLLRTGYPHDVFGEANVAVIFNSSFAPNMGDGGTLPSQRRYGMRIPLHSPEECVSLWPGPSARNNCRRQIFVNAMNIGADLQLSALYDGKRFEWSFGVVSRADSRVKRSDQEAFRLANKYTLLVTREALDGMLELIDSWSLDRKERVRVVRGLERGAVSEGDLEYLADLQVFLLGYYYGALTPLVDVTQLSTQEAIGSWTWYDHLFLVGVAQVVEHHRPTKLLSGSSESSSRIPSLELLRLVAYLFAGVESDQIAGLGESTQGAYGLNAKLVLLSASLLGNASTDGQVGKYVLLDIDPTAIPSDYRGVIRGGKQPKCAANLAAATSALKFSDKNELTLDFTSHIQPAWGFDPNQCLVTFRHHGRLVHKVHPGQLECTALGWMTSPIRPVSLDLQSAYDQTTSTAALEKAYRTALLSSTSQPLVDSLFDTLPKFLRNQLGIAPTKFEHDDSPPNRDLSSKPAMIFKASLSNFHGGKVVLPGKGGAARGKVIVLPILDPSLDLTRAPLCIISMYNDYLQPILPKAQLEKPLSRQPQQPSKLDCGYFNTDWNLLFPNASVCLMEKEWVLLLV